MWAAYLHGDDNLLAERDTLLDYGTLLTFSVDRGVDDTNWASPSKGSEGATADEADDDMALF
jgi:hypothetical protein